MESKEQVKLITKKDFDSIKTKYKEIKPEAQSVIDGAKNDLDILALAVQEGSGITVLNAKIMNEDNEDIALKLFKEGTI